MRKPALRWAETKKPLRLVTEAVLNESYLRLSTARLNVVQAPAALRREVHEQPTMGSPYIGVSYGARHRHPY